VADDDAKKTEVDEVDEIVEVDGVDDVDEVVPAAPTPVGQAAVIAAQSLEAVDSLVMDIRAAIDELSARSQFINRKVAG